MEEADSAAASDVKEVTSGSSPVDRCGGRYDACLETKK